MDTWALIVHPNPDLRDLLCGAVADLLPGTRCVAAENLARAHVLLDDWGMANCRLIVCSPTAPTDASEAPALDARDLHGVEFVRALRKQYGDRPAVIFPAAFTDGERAAALAGLKNARCIGMRELYRQLKREVDIFVLGKNDPALYHVDVDILLRSDQQCRWSMRGADGGGVEDTGVIDIQKREMDSLMALSMPAAAAAGNEDFLRTLGSIVYRTLMNPVKSDDLERKLQDSVEPLGGMEFARIRFNVDAQTQRILLETLAIPDKVTAQPEFCMKKAPMFRKLGSRGARQPLFQDPRRRSAPVDCLLVQGRSDAFAVGGTFQRAFNAVPNAGAEIDWLRDYLETNAQDYGIGQVAVLRQGEQAGSFAQAIEQALAAHEYAVVHYAGHSALDRNGQGWLVVGDGPDEQIEVDRFARWAREVQFVFLSSCESASSQFIVRLVEQEVPSVIGYAWPVQDSVALEFANTFYSKLFGSGRDRRLLDYSFMAAKQALHRQWPDLSHWAAPLLFMQVIDARSTADLH